MRCSTWPTSQLFKDDFGFETNDDILNQPGRMIQPGTFTVSVEGSQAGLRLQGDAENVSAWTRLSTYVRGG